MEIMKRRIRLGVDVGGTFTDIVCLDSGGGVRTAKVPSTPDDPSRAVMLALDGLQLGNDDVVDAFAHGTTVATNALIERKGAQVGLLATHGFEDTLEIGRQIRAQMYEVRLRPQTPVFIAPGRRRMGVRERIGASGEVVTPLDETSVVDAVDALVADGAQSIAVCLLFSFLNDTHEQRIKAIIAERHPGLDVSLSSEVDPAFREYERTAVTAFDAYIKPVVISYLRKLAIGLVAREIRAPLRVMQSRGGLAHAELAVERPVRLFLSGPAAGVLGAQAVGRAVGEANLISVDIGGTSCDIALVSDSKPLIRSEGIIEGFPVRVPMVDVNAIGSGGGSVAWIDKAGGLRVGPRSAGASPGPACYDQGGSEPTVTDASVVLGLIDPDYFADGALKLNAHRARDAIADAVAKPLGLSVERAAAGILQVLNAQMAEGIRLVSIKQGHDPRNFALVPLGGAGSLQACALADELGMTRILVPPHPGVLAATGLLSAPIEHEASAAFGHALDDMDLATVENVLDQLDRRCESMMEREGIESRACVRSWFADVCYQGQGYHLTIPLSRQAELPLAQLYEDFLIAHERVYGYAVRSAAKIVNLRSVSGCHETIDSTPAVTSPTPSTPRFRQVFTNSQNIGAAAWMQIPVTRRESLTTGNPLRGPHIVEQPDTTLLVAAGWIARLHETNVVELERDAS
jgi:N-methylhydantoinase A/oxoprolinase/acetone carboxylase beta subunit